MPNSTVDTSNNVLTCLQLYIDDMEESNLEEESTPNAPLDPEKNERKTVVQLFGIEMTAPKGMKNPIRLVITMITLNLLLLFLLSKAF